MHNFYAVFHCFRSRPLFKLLLRSRNRSQLCRASSCLRVNERVFCFVFGDNTYPQLTNHNSATETSSIQLASTLILINTESYVDRSARRVNRAAWKQSQCVASGQTGTPSAAAGAAHGGGQPTALVHFGNQHTLPRPSSALSHSQQSSVSISSGSVSSIASSLATSGATGKQKQWDTTTHTIQQNQHNPSEQRQDSVKYKILWKDALCSQKLIYINKHIRSSITHKALVLIFNNCLGKYLKNACVGH